MKSNETGGPAFPELDFVAGPAGVGSFSHKGMTLRQYAAIKLKVPESGNDWLDAMIEKSLRDDFAAKAMQSFLVAGGTHYLDNRAREAYEMADAMLKARKGGPA